MSDNMNPWGDRGKKPADLDDLVQQGVKKMMRKLQGKGGGGDGDSPKGGLKPGILFFLFILLYLAIQSFFQIQPGEQGVVLRFGKFHHTAGPGLNFKLPVVEKVIKVDVESIRKEEFGFRRAISPSRRSFGNTSRAKELESLMITSDKNVIQLNWVVQYKIRDPELFLFSIKSSKDAVRDISESVIRRLVGNRDFNYVLNNRDEVGSSTKLEMQQLLNKYNSGLQLVVVQLQDVNPPDPVRPSFNEVNEAEQDKIRLGNEAQKEANEKIPKAKGVALQMIQSAEGYAAERINNAKGEVARFNSIYKEYISAKQVTRTRMYVETLKEVLPNLQEVIILDQDEKSVLPLYNIGNTSDLIKKR